MSLYLADLEVTDGVPAVGDRAVGVGAWGAFDEPKEVMGPKGVKLVRFHLTVPADAEPGDHLGAVVAESAPSGPAGGIGVIKRVAARLYVTVPGDAKPALEIEKLEAHADGAFLPRHATASFSVRNTGNVRLDVRVTVNGRRANGPSTIVSESAESYTARTPLSIWGGRPTITVRVTTETSAGAGPMATRSRRLLIVPWWIGLALFLLALGVVVVRELRRRLR